jgi:hypothetical protein
MLAYFLQIYQQIWKLETEDVKVLVYEKVSRNTMKVLYIFVPDLCMIFRSAVKKALQGQTHCLLSRFKDEGAPPH